MSKLERIVHDDSNGLDYILVGEIYLPLIAVSEEKRDIGFYGSLHRNYLKDYKGGLYSSAKAAPTKQKKVASPCQACGKQSGTRTSKSNTTTGIGKNNAKNSPAGQPRSASMRWIIWKGYLFRSYSRQEDGMTDRE